MEEILLINNLKKNFGKTEVLKGVNLTLKEGKILCILGKSGCGKTTLLKIIVGLISPDEGEVIFEGKNISELSVKEKSRKISMVFQHSALFDSLDVKGNVGFFLKEHTDLPDEDIILLVKDRLSRVGLSGTEDLRIEELSGGMRKRVAIARALITQPRLILYDEPTVGIDPATAKSIINLMKELHNNSVLTSIVVTQDISCALSLADEIALLDSGRIIVHFKREEFSMHLNKVVQLREFLGEWNIYGNY